MARLKRDFEPNKPIQQRGDNTNEQAAGYRLRDIEVPQDFNSAISKLPRARTRIARLNVVKLSSCMGFSADGWCFCDFEFGLIS